MNHSQVDKPIASPHSGHADEFETQWNTTCWFSKRISNRCGLKSNNGIGCLLSRASEKTWGARKIFDLTKVIEILIYFVGEVTQKIRASCFIKGSRHLEIICIISKTIGIIYISVFRTPDETLSLVFDIFLTVLLSDCLHAHLCTWTLNVCTCL